MKRYFLKSMFITLLIFGMISCSNDDGGSAPQSFTYSNNNLNTGSVSSNGTNAPEGYHWSEIKVPFYSFGFGANLQSNYSLSDDFTIPEGEEWNIENFYFYAYKTDFTGESFPLSEVYLEVHSSKPSISEEDLVYGDYTTNRFASSEATNLYRIIQSQASLTNRKLFKIKVNTNGLVLNQGTYWFKLTAKLSDGTAFFFAGNPYKEPNDFNAIQKSGTVWADLYSGDEKSDITFDIEGKK